MALTAGALALFATAVAVAVQDRPADNAACQSNLKQVALGVLMYQQDYDEMYPPMRTAAQVQNRVLPYVKNRAMFRCPVTGTDYLPNPVLNYRTLAWVASPAEMTMFRDDRPHDQGGRAAWNVAFADGHVKVQYTEPRLGAPAPDPKPVPRRIQIERELERLRFQRRNIDARIRQLEAQQRRERR
jgi:prepilin-type processing-associated H-X9-DG protein